MYTSLSQPDKKIQLKYCPFTWKEQEHFFIPQSFGMFWDPIRGTNQTSKVSSFRCVFENI
jgi:hypothetical protein